MAAQPQPTDYTGYKKWREDNANNLKLPADWQELSTETFLSSAMVWSFQWFLQCGADKYVRIWERYDRWPKLIHMSRRIGFAFHYGPIINRNKDGIPTQNDQVDIRIDDVGRPVHMHFGAQDPHHDQSVVKGLKLDDMDMFQFLNGIIRHRDKNKPLDQVFGFKIE